MPAKFANPVFNASIPPPFADLRALPNAPRSRFRYLVVIDFEATCDYCALEFASLHNALTALAPTPVVDTASAEIIEFPICVLDAHFNCVIDRRQLFVRPDKMEGITYYCTKLTGITPGHVQNAPSLSDALIQVRQPCAFA